MIKAFNKQNLRTLRTDLESALTQVAAKHGILIRLKTAVVLTILLCTFAVAQPLPDAPSARKASVVEHDPGAWFATGMFTPVIVGCFTKPSYGLAAGVAIDVLANMQNSRNAHQNMVGAIGGSVAGYLIIKTLKRDWHHRK